MLTCRVDDMFYAQVERQFIIAMGRRKNVNIHVDNRRLIVRSILSFNLSGRVDPTQIS